MKHEGIYPTPHPVVLALPYQGELIADSFNLTDTNFEEEEEEKLYIATLLEHGDLILYAFGVSTWYELDTVHPHRF